MARWETAAIKRDTERQPRWASATVKEQPGGPVAGVMKLGKSPLSDEIPLRIPERLGNEQDFARWSDVAKKDEEAERERRRGLATLNAGADGSGFTEDEAGNLTPGIYANPTDRDLSTGIATAPLQFGRGLAKAAENTINLSNELGTAGYNAAANLFNPSRPQTAPLKADFARNKLLDEGGPAHSMSGDAVSYFSQFAGTRVPIGKMAPGGGYGAEMAKDSAALMTGIAGDQGRVSDMIDPSTPVVGPLAKLLATKPGDSDLVGRGKNTIEDLMLGGPILGAFKGIEALGHGAKAGSRLPPIEATATPVPPTPRRGPPSLNVPATAASTAAPPPGTLQPVPRPAQPGPVSTDYRNLSGKVKKAFNRLLINSGVPKQQIPTVLAELDNLPPDRMSMVATELMRRFGKDFQDIPGNVRAVGRDFSVNAPQPTTLLGGRDQARNIVNNNVREAMDAERPFLEGVAEQNFGPGVVPTKEAIDADVEKIRGAYRKILDPNKPYGTVRSPKKIARIEASRQTLIKHLKEFDRFEGIPDWVRTDTIHRLNRELRATGQEPIEPGTVTGVTWTELVDRYPTQIAHSLQSSYATAAREAGKSTDMRGGATARDLAEKRGRSAVRANAASMEDRGYGLLKLLEDAVPGYKETRVGFGHEMGAIDALTLPERFMAISNDEAKLGQFLDDLDELTPDQFKAAQNQITTLVRNEMNKKIESPTLAEVGAGERGASNPNLQRLSQRGVLEALEKAFGDEGQKLADAIRLSRANTDELSSIDPKFSSRTEVNRQDAQNAPDLYEDPKAGKGNIIDNTATVLAATGAMSSLANPPAAAGLLTLAAARALWNAHKAGKKLSPRERTQLATFMFQNRRAEAAPTDGPRLPPPPDAPTPSKPPAPPEKAGLFTSGSQSLPMDEGSRMKRAREQGFDVDTPLYRGSTSPYNEDRSGRRWFSTNPETAGGYAKIGDGYYDGATVTPVFGRLGRTLEINARKAQWDDVDFDRIVDADPAVAKRLNKSDFSTDDVARAAQDAGYDSVRIKNVRDESSRNDSAKRIADTIVIFDPKNIRGKFAKFDPSDQGSSKLLAGLGGPVGSQVAPAVGAATVASVGPEGEPFEDKIPRMLAAAGVAAGFRNAGTAKKLLQAALQRGYTPKHVLTPANDRNFVERFTSPKVADTEAYRREGSLPIGQREYPRDLVQTQKSINDTGVLMNRSGSRRVANEFTEGAARNDNILPGEPDSIDAYLVEQFMRQLDDMPINEREEIIHNLSKGPDLTVISGGKRPPDSQGFPPGGKGGGGKLDELLKGPKLAPRVIKELERGAKVLSPEARAAIAANAERPPGMRVSAAEATGDDPSLYSMAAPFQVTRRDRLRDLLMSSSATARVAGEALPNPVATGVREGLDRITRRAGGPPPLAPLAETADLAEKQRRAAVSEATRINNARNTQTREALGLPDQPLPKGVGRREQQATEMAIAARKALAAANLEAMSHTDALAKAEQRKEAIAAALRGEVELGPPVRSKRVGVAGLPARARQLKPSSHDEARQMAELLFNQEQAKLLDDVLSGRVKPRNQDDHHVALALATLGGVGAAGWAAMLGDLKSGNKQNKRGPVMPEVSLPDTSYKEDPMANSSDFKRVREIQTMLQALGAPIKPDGVMLRRDGGLTSTQRIVKQIQEANGLEPSGLLDDRTIDLVSELYRESLVRGAGRKRTPSAQTDLATAATQ